MNALGDRICQLPIATESQLEMERLAFRNSFYIWCIQAIQINCQWSVLSFLYLARRQRCRISFSWGRVLFQFTRIYSMAKRIQITSSHMSVAIPKPVNFCFIPAASTFASMVLSWIPKMSRNEATVIPYSCRWWNSDSLSVATRVRQTRHYCCGTIRLC